MASRFFGSTPVTRRQAGATAKNEEAAPVNIAPGAADKAALIPTSLERLQHANAQLERTRGRDLATLRQILLDDSQAEMSINASYRREPSFGHQDVGTCATILMDLRARCIEIKKGPGDGDFLRLSV